MLQRLKRDYNTDEPIILSKIDYPDKTKDALKNALQTLAFPVELRQVDMYIYDYLLLNEYKDIITEYTYQRVRRPIRS